MFSVALASSCPPYGVVEDRCACSALGGLDSSREEAKLTGRSKGTALIWACENGHVEAARLLVEKGADMNAQDGSARELCVWWRRSFRPGAAFPFGWRRILGVGEVRSGMG